ncbi:hypothetical protein SFRURICE_008987 [Spodoptera frugiperda]|nr:hypothetical protein SFRURICE_008987 [Spodoptera frugiperda]
MLPHWSSGCKCDCWARGLGFNSRVGQTIGSLLLHGTYNTIWKSGCTLYSGTTCRNVHLCLPLDG